MPLSVAAAAQAVRSGELSPLDHLQAVLAHIARVEPWVQAFVALDEESVTAEAVRLTEEAARGRFRGPLHGVPIAVKDVIDVRGMPTRAGSQVTDDVAARDDAVPVSRIRAAGGLILGKTSTHEFAHGVTTPPTKNPWDLSRIPGGSSGGSAAAVAADECPAALGSDTGGSIRLPAALCGVSGVRPEPGLVPTQGIVPFSPRLDTCGPIAGSATDLCLLLRVLSNAPIPLPGSMDGVRVATPSAASLGDVDPEITAAVDAALLELKAAGAEIVTVDLPRFEEWERPRSVYVLGDFLQVHRDAGWYPSRASRYGEELRGYLELAESFTSRDREAASAELHALRERMSSAMDGVDLLALPTTAVTAPTIEELSSRPLGMGRHPAIALLMRLLGPISWCGYAAASVPCGMTGTGMPIGLQLVARTSSVALNAAVVYQERTDHHLQKPPMPPLNAGTSMRGADDPQPAGAEPSRVQPPTNWTL